MPVLITLESITRHSPPFVHSTIVQGGCASQNGGESSGKPDDVDVEEGVPLTLAEGYEYIGCFHDKFPMSERDMSLTTKREFPLNKPRMCANRCSKEDGAAFFGLQNGGL